MVPDAYAAVVETGQHPWLGGMEIHAFDAVRPSGELALDVQPERLQEIKWEKKEESLVTVEKSEFSRNNNPR